MFQYPLFVTEEVTLKNYHRSYLNVSLLSLTGHYKTVTDDFPISSHFVAETKVLLENGWNSKQMITEGEAAIPLETTQHAFRNQEKTKQRSTTYTFFTP